MRQPPPNLLPAPLAVACGGGLEYQQPLTHRTPECSLPSAGIAPSVSAPGGLSPEQTPQFILLTVSTPLRSAVRAWHACCCLLRRIPSHVAAAECSMTTW